MALSSGLGCDVRVLWSSLTPPPLPRISLSVSSLSQVGDQEVTLPAIPSDNTYVGLSGRFVELRTTFGLSVRWDGDQQLFVTVSR